MQGETQSSSAAQQDVAQTSAFLLSFFQGVCLPGQAEHSHLQKTLAMCLGDYAAWFGRYAAARSILQHCICLSLVLMFQNPFSCSVERGWCLCVCIASALERSQGCQ